MKVRGHARVQIRQFPQVRSGTFDDGRSWSVREVELIDEDQNKTSIRCPDGVDVAPGEYDIVFDAATKGSSRVELVSATPVKKG